jgi:putative MATE family efflux protein
MPQEIKHRADKPLIALALPMYFESLLRSLFSSADVFMLAFFSQSAVAAVGLANNYSFFLMLMYSVVTAGASVLISQYLGAGRDREAGEASLASFILAAGFSAALSLGMAFGAPLILSVYRLDPEVRRYALEYLVITGGGSVFVAYNIVQATVLRTHGRAVSAMVSNIIANAINVIGNSIAIFGPFGIPKTGVIGVAVSTVASQAMACAILSYHIRRHKEIVIPWKDFARLPRKLFAKVLSIGIPVAGESLSYNVSQIFISWIVAGFGTAALSANTYAITLLRFVFMPALALGSAGQIKTGYLVGAGRYPEAKRNVWKYTVIGFCISAAIITIMYLARIPILSFFTKDGEILALSAVIFLISIPRETGRVANIVITPALKGSGDVLFPVVIGIVFMWIVGAGGAFLLGKVLGWGLAGVWIAIAADEWFRTVCVALRWQSGAWKSKALVKGPIVSEPCIEIDGV